MVINGVFWRTRAGIPWRDLPAEYGSWKTVYNRHRRWSLDGTWSAVLDRLRVGADLDEGADWTVGVDSTVARAHQHAAGASRSPMTLRRSRKRSRAVGSTSWTSRGPRSSQGAEPNCKDPPAAGQRGDSPECTVVLDKVSIARPGRGRPRRRPGRVLADKAYSSAANRTWLRRRGIRAVIPVKTDQAAHRRNCGSFGGHPHRFDPLAYKERNVVERCINKLKQFRAVATRYDKRQRIYQGTVDVALIRIWLKGPVT